MLLPRKNFHIKLILLLSSLLLLIASVFLFKHIRPYFNEGASLPVHEISAKDASFLSRIRSIISSYKFEERDKVTLRNLFKESSFADKVYGCALVVYSANQERILVLRSGQEGVENVIAAIETLIKKKTLLNVDWQNHKTRLQIDLIYQKPISVDKGSLATHRGFGHVELGVDGFIAKGKKNVVFLPGDAYVKSYFAVREIVHFLRRSFTSEEWSNIDLLKFRTISFVDYHSKWIPLFRGHPMLGNVSSEHLEYAVRLAVRHVQRHQREDGKFLYYYDAAKDSLVDHEHPKRNPIRNPYYNELRHIGGLILLLYDYENNKDRRVLLYAKRAIDYIFKNVSKTYITSSGQEAIYLYNNRKAKLGGAGLALYALSYYQHLTGDSQYEDRAHALSRHLISQITDTGEFIYYYIYLDKRVSLDENKNYFSFYYPGEALIGLIAYYKYLVKDSIDYRQKIRDQIAKALDFLINERPKLYQSKFTRLPSDSWLMMAINELWDIPELREERYKKFVYEEALTMVSLMYTEKDAYFADYVGAFYYFYGDFPYADGARCEGLLAAYELSVKAGDKEFQEKFFWPLKKSAWATYHLVNTPESVYAHPNSEMSIGGIRFKHTRQWFRIDTIQHVAAFYLKFLRYLN